MTNDTTDDDPEFTGETHLEPSYRPDWGNSNTDWEDGQIHLEGELDFPADQPAENVATSLQDRAEQIGAIVTHNHAAGHIDAYPWNGPGFFRLVYDPDEPDARVEEIVVFDGNDDVASSDTIEELKERGERAAKIADSLTPSDESDEEGELFRITADGLEPVDEDDVDL